MGLGIERRASRYAESWEQHFAQTKRTQRDWLAGCAEGAGSAAVLGAGRLYDCALEDLRAVCKEVSLLDADALCLSVWRKAEKKKAPGKLNFEILEMTGRLFQWEKEFREYVSTASFEEALRLLDGISLRSSEEKSPLDAFFEQRRPTHVVSLNILSQLPVMWQNAVERVLVARFGEEARNRETEWLTSYAPSARMLIREHLESLSRSAAANILLITDVEYYSYPLASFAHLHPPLIWKEESENGGWAVPNVSNSAELLSSCESYDALMGVNIENKKLLSLMFPGYESTLRASWLWYILPQGENGGAMGTVHRVRAIELRQKKS